MVTSSARESILESLLPSFDLVNGTGSCERDQASNVLKVDTAATIAVYFIGV